MAKHGSKSDRPSKPYPDFPLFAHATGRWAKKIRQKLHYFGPWDDWKAALDRYECQRDDLYAGRKPRRFSSKDQPGVTVKYVVNSFLTAKRKAVAAGKIKQRTFTDYLRTGTTIINTFGRGRDANDLRPDDFAQLKGVFNKTCGLVGTSNEIRRTRSMFKWLAEMQIIDHRPTYGPEFRQASVSDLRKDRQRKRAEHGAPMFTADQIRTLMDSATVPMRAMILLGINCGMGQTDCSELRETHIDLDAGVLEYPRPKTGIERRAILWPETVAAIRAALEARPAPRGTTPGGSVFITRHGKRWVRHTDKGTNIDSITLEFNKLLKAADLKRKGLGLYSLRRTFETVAGETTDQPAVDRVMGHEDANRMSTRYTVKIDDDRLKAVCDHVRAWLEPKAPKSKKKTTTATKKRSTSKRKSGKPNLRLVG